MRRIFLLFVLMHCCLFGNERSLDKLQALQNFDGSFGKVAEDRVVTTSSVLLSYMSQNLIVKYSETTSGAVKFILKESDALCRQEPTLKHLAALRALSEYYGISRQDNVREMCLRLRKCIYRDFANKRWHLKGKSSEYFLHLTLALFACDSSKADSISRKAMTALGVSAAKELELNYKSGLFFRLHSGLWGLSRKINAGQMKFGTVSEKLVNMLDSNSSKERKAALNESLLMSVKDRVVLIEALKICKSLELKLTAGDLAAKMKLSEILKCDLDYAKNSLQLMQIISYVHYGQKSTRANWSGESLDIFKKAGNIDSPLELDALKGRTHDLEVIKIATAITAAKRSA